MTEQGSHGIKAFSPTLTPKVSRLGAGKSLGDGTARAAHPN